MWDEEKKLEIRVHADSYSKTGGYISWKFHFNTPTNTIIEITKPVRHRGMVPVSSQEYSQERGAKEGDSQ